MSVTPVFRQHTRIGVSALAFLVVAASAQAQTAGAAAGAAQDPAAVEIRQELDRLRQEFESLRDTYGARLAALEAKLALLPPGTAPPEAVPPAVERSPDPPAVPGPQGTPVAVVPAEPAARTAAGPQPTPSTPTGGSALSKVFNPDVAVVGNFTGAAGSNAVDPRPAFELGESEVSLQSIVDPYARADFFFSFSPEGVEVEEGFITFTALPGGLLAKAGKFRQQIGKANTLHSHGLPWVDGPLVLGNLLGSEEGISDSGISVSKLVLNPWFFLEATGEVYQGNSGLFQSHERNDVSWVGRVRGYRDLTESTNLDVGGSFARGHNDAGPGLTTRLYSLDATVRYRPLRRAIYRRILGRSELFWSRREQDPGVASAFGMYASGEYQFGRRWFAGARYDWSERAANPLLEDKGVSALVTFWPSEFSQIRGQYRRTRYAEGVTANELLFQFLFSIGAHGAHVF